MIRLRTIVAALSLALLAPGGAALAQQNAIDFSKIARGEIYQDLPGVIPTEELEARKGKVVCTRKPAERSLGGRWRPGEDTVYSCTQGNLTVETNQLPRSRERDLRGIGW